MYAPPRPGQSALLMLLLFLLSLLIPRPALAAQVNLASGDSLTVQLVVVSTRAIIVKPAAAWSASCRRTDRMVRRILPAAR